MVRSLAPFEEFGESCVAILGVKAVSIRLDLDVCSIDLTIFA